MAIRPGDIVTVRGSFGTEAPQRVFVTDTGEEAGRPVVDYIDASGRTRWAYLDQVEAVEPEKAVA